MRTISVLFQIAGLLAGFSGYASNANLARTPSNEIEVEDNPAVEIQEADSSDDDASNSDSASTVVVKVKCKKPKVPKHCPVLGGAAGHKVSYGWRCLPKDKHCPIPQ